MGALPTSGNISLLQVRNNVQLSGAFNIRHRRAIWIAFLKDSKTYTGSISMSNFRGKDYDTSWVWYGSEELFHSRGWSTSKSYQYSEGQVLTAPYVSGDWQYRTVVKRVEESYRNYRYRDHRRKGRWRKDSSARYRDEWSYKAFRQQQRRAW